MKTTIQNITKNLDETKNPDIEADKICKTLAKKDFIFLPKKVAHQLLLCQDHDLTKEWNAFKESWNRLEKDTFMADGGNYRYRRHTIYQEQPDSTELLALQDQPHYQTSTDNSLNGGVARYFPPLEPSTTKNKFLIMTLGFCRNIFSRLAPCCEWQIEVHQFRINASNDAAYPTPEGIHRDGVNFVFMMLIKRHQITGGLTSIYDRQGILLNQQILTEEMEIAILNDDWVTHGVSPIFPSHTNILGYRDMLVITFRKI